jgi:hypothetical protein
MVAPDSGPARNDGEGFHHQIVERVLISAF